MRFWKSISRVESIGEFISFCGNFLLQRDVTELKLVAHRLEITRRDNVGYDFPTGRARNRRWPETARARSSRCNIWERGTPVLKQWKDIRKKCSRKIDSRASRIRWMKSVTRNTGCSHMRHHLRKLLRSELSRIYHEKNSKKLYITRAWQLRSK